MVRAPVWEDRTSLNGIPLVEWYRRHPDDLTTLEIATGSFSGQMSNIDEAGAPAIYFHDLPHVMEHGPPAGLEPSTNRFA